jgi:hypothetical protein
MVEKGMGVRCVYVYNISTQSHAHTDRQTHGCTRTYSPIHPTTPVTVPSHSARARALVHTVGLSPAAIWGYLAAVQAFAAATGVDAICIDPMNASLVRFTLPGLGIRAHADLCHVFSSV